MIGTMEELDDAIGYLEKATTALDDKMWQLLEVRRTENEAAAAETKPEG